jgi:pepF/M3 family oligoendopeptidase
MKMPVGSKPPPRWKLGAIYPSFDSPEYRRDLALLKERTAALEALLALPLPEIPAGLPAGPVAGSGGAPPAAPPEVEEAAAALLALLRAAWEAEDIAENLDAYARAVYTTDTRDSRSLGEINALEAAALPLKKAALILQRRLAEREKTVRYLAETHRDIRPYGFFLRETLEKAAFRMSPELEDLANDLSRSGGDAWERLHEAVSSTACALWDGATGERKTVVALRDLAHHPDRGVRERAYRAEMEAWKAVEIPLAASLNGVKGTAITLDRRRGWIGGGAGAETGSLRKSAFQSRLGGKSLEALIAALEQALPLFRGYLKTKARLLGLERCAFYDLFAPLGTAAKTWAWDEAADFIAARFDRFDPAMGAFARHAFAFSWIDAEGRPGKVGGAYCTDFPLAGESRILCNFEGSFDSVTTVAHELGHGWHHELIKDLPRGLSRYPMTLAETASIFAETIVVEGALESAEGAERLGLIEGNLKDSCQVIVDILSRFYFERVLFSRREGTELSPEELNALMLEAQGKTYGDGLDPALLHPYMWAVKSHYYSPGLAFYNYPYAFGLLFSLGLYARYQREGPSFAAAYKDLLRLTGRASAEEAARSAGFNIETVDFWLEGLGIIARRAREFEGLAAGSAAAGPGDPR